MTGLRSLLWRVAGEADLLLSDVRRERLGREAMLVGRRLLPSALAGERGAGRHEITPAGSLGLADPALPRILGLGSQQAAGLATIAGTPARARPEVARLGGLLNLGVALFDHVCDKSPQSAELLLATVTPERLDEQLRAGGRAAPPSGDAGVDLLMALIANFFTGVHGLGGSPRDRRTFAHLIRGMYGGQRFVTAAKRERDRPTPRVWWELRHKSVLPMETMALLALLAHPHAGAQRRSTVRLAAALAGEAIWIVDDLADVGEDWSAGCWSRPLWLLAHAPGQTAANADDAIRRLLATGIADAEAHRLAGRLRGLRDLPGAPERAFLRPVQMVVHSWIESVPD
jgi:hypothetical protein